MAKYAKVRRHGKVHQLPVEIRKEVDDLLTTPGVTYDDIEAYLKDKGHDISTSSIGRYGAEFLAQYQRLRIIEDQARTLVSQEGDGLILDEAAGKLMARKMIEVIMADRTSDKALPEFADGLSRLIKANVSREQFKANLQKKVDKAATDVTKIVKQNGLSDATAAQIRAKILGVAK